MGIRTYEIAVEIPADAQGEALDASRNEAVTMWWDRARAVGTVVDEPTAKEITVPRRGWEVAGLVEFPE